MSTATKMVNLPAPVPRFGSTDYVGQMSQFIGLYGRELLKTFRNPFVIVITLVQPFMWLAFFGGMFSTLPATALAGFGIKGSSYLAFLLPGVLSTSVMSIGMFGSMSTIQDKRFGFMKRILITPTTKTTVYLTKALGSATRGMVQIPVMLVAATVFGVQLKGTPLEWCAWILGLIFLGFGFSAFFLAITASSTDWQTPGVVSNFITMPLMFASGAMFPTSIYPWWMKDIASVNPVGFSASLSRNVLTFGTFGNPELTALGYLALFAAIMLISGTLISRKYLKVE